MIEEQEQEAAEPVLDVIEDIIRDVQVTYADGPHRGLASIDPESAAHAAREIAALSDVWPLDARFALGAFVQKKGRASWRGKVVGWYRTDLTALGFAVESAFEPGSVQIYQQTALEPWDGGA